MTATLRGFLPSWANDLSIGSRILLLVLVTLAPAIGFWAWMLSSEMKMERAAAEDQMMLLAAGTADDLRRELQRYQSTLEHLAARPLALDPARCVLFAEEFVLSSADHVSLAVRNRQGQAVCAYGPTLVPKPEVDLKPWVASGAKAADLRVSDVGVSPSGAKVLMLSQPIRNGAEPVGDLLLGLGLLELNQRLLSAVPPEIVVSVLDNARHIALRSAQPEAYIGMGASGMEPESLADAQTGHMVVKGPDGVQRLYAFQTIPEIGWRVLAGVPEALVLAPGKATLKRTALVGLGVLLLVIALAWGVSATIVGPVLGLRRVAARVAGGDAAARVVEGGPAEIQSVARQFNQMLDALKAAEDRLKGIFDSAVDAIITTNEQQVIVQVNRAAAEMFHTTVEDMIGGPLERYVAPRLRERHRVAMQAFGAAAASARHMGVGRELLALRADGEEFPVESSISYKQVNGQQLYTVIHRDVTERLQAQHALLVGKAKLEAALASMTDAVFISDIHGHFDEFNDAFVRFHRFKDRASCRHTLSEYPEILEVYMANGQLAPLDQWAVPRALRGEIGNTVEYRLRRKDTGESWIGSYSFAPIRDKHGAITGSVVVARDITALREAQLDLESSHSALQRLIAAQDRVQEDERARIARELHDDLQQTLAAIRMDLGELGDRLGGLAPTLLPTVVELDGLAAQAIVSTRRIVNDLRPPMLEDLGIVPAVQALATQFSQRHGIECHVHAEEDVGEALQGSPQLVTCLYRLTQEALNNVIKHAGANRVDIQVQLEPDDQVRLAVIDNGRGIQVQDRGKPGSYGLASMQERARAQGGTLRVDAAAAGGTLLLARLPLAKPTSLSEAGAGQARPGQGWQAGEPHDETGAPQFLDSGSAPLGDGPLPRVLSRAIRQTLQSAIDAMVGNVAVLSPKGTLQLVNQAWVEFADRNGGAGTSVVGPGVDYLAVCRRAVLTDDSVTPALEGLEDVIAGRRPEFSCDYPCHSPDEHRWYRMRATALPSGQVLVSHQAMGGPPRTPGSDGH